MIINGITINRVKKEFYDKFPSLNGKENIQEKFILLYAKNSLKGDYGIRFSIIYKTKSKVTYEIISDHYDNKEMKVSMQKTYRKVKQSIIPDYFNEEFVNIL